MHFSPKMLHLIMTLLVHGAYTESVKCPEACSCIETLISGSYKAVARQGFDETMINKKNSKQTEEECTNDTGDIEAIDKLYKLKDFSDNTSHTFPRTKKCAKKNNDKDQFLSIFSMKSVKILETLYSNSMRTKRTLKIHSKMNFNETSENISQGENKIAAMVKPSSSDSGKDIFTYQITCTELHDLKSIWIRYLPRPATELNIQRTNFQSFKVFQQILKESSLKLSQLTVLSVSDSVINQKPYKSYSVKIKSTNKKEIMKKGKHSEFLPFASLQNLKPSLESKVDFSSNGKSKNLRVLNLTNSTLLYLPQDTFLPFINLQVLNISNNLIEFIDNETFSSLVNLLHLDVHNNRLQFLNEIMFKNLTKLVFLDVSQNLISNLEPSTFQYLISLNILILANNPLLEKQGVVLLGTGKRLKIVDISETGLKQIPGTLERSVRALNLMGNFLLSIRCGDLDSYSLLSYLNLKSNKISYIEDDALGRLEFLKNLQISENNLFQIPKILPNNLEILNLSFNNIQNITNSDFLNLFLLKELSLSYNQVTSVEENAFNNLVHLTVLDLSHNPILVLPNIFRQIKLKVLNLSYFKNLQGSSSTRFGQFPVQWPQSIKYLNLESSPALTKIFLQDTAALKSFVSLEELNLRFTNLTTISKDVFSFLSKLRVLKVEGNPWHCGREILTLSTWLRSHEMSQTSQDEDEINSAHCLTPPQLYKTNLITLGEKNFEKDQNKRSNRIISMKSTIINRDLASEKSRGKTVNVPENQLQVVKKVNVKTHNKTIGTLSFLNNNNITGVSDRECCSRNPEEKPAPSRQVSTDANSFLSERESNQAASTNSSSEQNFIKWKGTSTESFSKIKNSLNSKPKQVSLLALKKFKAVTAKGTLTHKKEYSSHLSFLTFSYIGLVVLATLTFTSLYFSRMRRDQSYQRQNQDIEVCSISSRENELW